MELSSTALKFKADQTSVKAVLLALEPVHQVLQSLGDENVLDEKLAEYAFFPLTHLFNQSRRLSPHSLEVAVRCVQILVSQGWRDKLLPEMAKQLLILLGLLVSPSPNQPSQTATDELKVASFECISVILVQTARLEANVLEGVGEKNIVDQLVYQLLESLSMTPSDKVQISAAHALLELNNAINKRALLASLLPRTVSTLVKVLRPSTEARRTRKVLVAYLDLLTVILKKIFADDVAFNTNVTKAVSKTSKSQNADDAVILDKSWLDATTPQIDLALVQVVKLRTCESSDVAQCLLNLCLLVIEECPQSLARSIPLMVETLVVLGRSSESSMADAALRHLVIVRPEISDILSAKFHDWCQALPRVMQGHDDKPKQQMLGQVATSFITLTTALNANDDLTGQIATVLVDSVSTAVESGSTKSKLIDEAPQATTTDLIQQAKQLNQAFKPVILDHQSQRSSTAELRGFVASLQSHSSSQSITRSIIEQTQDLDINRRLSATWLALQFLQPSGSEVLDVGDFIIDDSTEPDLSLSRPFLISDLYALTVPGLLHSSDFKDEVGSDWRLVALSLECLTLQASQLGRSYRPELLETLFPLLTFLGSDNSTLQHHAMTALNLLAAACDYDSAAQMLIDNVDYLVNAIALRLNAFDVSRDGLQVLSMMIHLCGAGLLPHLDDVIGSIFGALDNFHGYPHLVDHLFELLKMMVEESSKNPGLLAIEGGERAGKHERPFTSVSTVEDILFDLRGRKDRKNKSDEEHEHVTSAPHQPWANMNTATSGGQTDASESQASEEDDNPPDTGETSKEPKLSKPHQLLLDIARSAVPHMSSPSAKVRFTLLELLQKICPLLAQHENTFLPLVNSLWPAIVPRLLSSKEGSLPEMPYNIQAAADTVSIICRAAGDFLSSRIEGIFSDLEGLFKRLSVAVVASNKRQIASSTTNGIRTNLGNHHTVQVQIGNGRDIDHSAFSSGGAARTMDGQILDALVALFVAILQNVRMSEDNADRIFDMLGPFVSVPGNAAVSEALLEYNEDVVWLMKKNHGGRDIPRKPTR